MIAFVLALTMAAVIFSQSNMMRSVNRASETTVISLLSDNANQVKSVLDSQIDSIWAYMKMIDSSFKVMKNMTEEDAVTFLSGILPRSYHVEIATEDGEYFDQYGKKGYVIPNEAAFRLFIDREQVCVLRQETADDTIMFGMPVSPVLIEGKEYGFALAYFKLDALMDILSVESFAGNGQIRVLNEDGFVIMSSDNIDSDKTSYYFFKIYENGLFMDNDVYSGFEGFRKSVMDGDNYAVHVALGSEDDHVISYAKLDRLDWYVTIVVDYDAVLGGLEKNVQTIGIMSIAFTVTVVIIALILVLIIVLDIRKIRQEKQQLQELNASLDHAKRVAEQALEIAENANRSKSDFLSNISHDIRTPMNAITGFTSLLAQNTDNPKKVMEYTQKIAASSRHLLGLINDVLDMSKIESGKTTLNLSEEAIGDIVRDIDAMFRPQMRAKKHTFRISVQNIVHERIIVDKTRLNQILQNLLSNAVKYTPDGGRIKLDISEINSSNNTAQYKIVVLDNGYGMSPEFVKTIFDSFSREEDSRTNRIQGTGLGMAITKQLVDLMGGSIEVESTKGEGSVFTVVLQFQLGGSDASPHFWEEKGIFRCLVADCDEAACINVIGSMERAGVRTDYVLNGKKALQLIQNSEPYQLIILGRKILIEDNAEIARKIRSIVPSDSATILLMGYEFTESELQDFEGIADGLLLKPFFVSSLKQEVREVLERKTGSAAEGMALEEQSIFWGKRILAAEDNELNSEILKELLAGFEAECVICENGRAALETFEKSDPGFFDLIFMDIQMPVMNGYEATRRIRSCAHPDAGRIPIIAMTADAFAEDIKTAIDSGMNAHVSKPVDMRVMEATVRQVLE